MRAHFEKLSSGSASLLVFERVDVEFPFHWHYHPEYELTLIVNSHGQRLVGDGIADYGPGDLVLLGPNLPHSWRSGPVMLPQDEFHRAVVIQFRENFLGEEFFKLEAMDQIARMLKRSASGLSFGHTKAGCKAAENMAAIPSYSPARRIVRLLDILVDLASGANATALSTDQLRPMCRVEDQQRIEAICAHLNEHFGEEIDFSDACAKSPHGPSGAVPVL